MARNYSNDPLRHFQIAEEQRRKQRDPAQHHSEESERTNLADYPNLRYFHIAEEQHREQHEQPHPQEEEERSDPADYFNPSPRRDTWQATDEEIQAHLEAARLARQQTATPQEYNFQWYNHYAESDTDNHIEEDLPDEDF